VRVGKGLLEHLLWNEISFEETFDFKTSSTNCEDVDVTFKLKKLPDAAVHAGLTSATLYKTNDDVVLQYKELEEGAPFGYMRGL